MATCKSSSRRSAIFGLAVLLSAAYLCSQTFVDAASQHPHQGPFPETPCSANTDCEIDFATPAPQMTCGSSGHCECPSSGTQSRHFNYYTGHCDTEKGLESKSTCINTCELDPYNAKSTCTKVSDSGLQKCLCNQGFTLHPVQNVCTRKYGEVCSKGFPAGREHQECWVQGEFFTCGRTSGQEYDLCGCYDPYVYDATTNSCVFEMHKSCSAGHQWEPKCQGGFYNECVGNCQCQAGFVFDEDSKTCTKKKGTSCTMRTSGEPDECDEKAMLQCREKYCQCKDGYEPDVKAGGVCKLKSKSECSSSKDCKKDFFCSAEGKCICPEGQVEVDGMCGCPPGQEIWKYEGHEAKCHIKSTSSTDCSDESSCGPNAHCSGSRCVCLPGASEIDGFCYFSLNSTVPDTVKSATACAPTFVFENNACVCPGVYDKFARKCVSSADEASTCATDADCEAIVARCAATDKGTRRCECKEGYKTEEGEKCVGGVYARPCGSDSHCDTASGLRCVSDICQCRNRNYALMNNRCVVRAGQPCNRKVDVCEPDFICSIEGRCLCSTEYGGNVVCPKNNDEEPAEGDGGDPGSKVVIDVNAYSSFVVYTFIVLAGIVLAAVAISVIILKGTMERTQRNWAFAIVENIKLMLIDSGRGNPNLGQKFVTSKPVSKA